MPCHKEYASNKCSTYRITAQRWFASNKELFDNMSDHCCVSGLELTSVIPRPAISRARCKGSWPSGDPSSKPIPDGSNNRFPGIYHPALTISVFSNAMWRCISNEDNHFARIRPPVHVQRVGHSSRYGFRTISAS